MPGAALLAPSPHPSSSWLPSTGPAQPIRAWFGLCERHPEECLQDPEEARRVVLTPAVWDLLHDVNSSVNGAITPMTDTLHHGVIDQWDFPTNGVGDCEDYQLLKRRFLINAGLPRRAMRMTVVIDELGEGHAVLTVRTDRGDFLLDNKTNAILRWDETTYTFVKRESGRTGAWVSLGNAVPAPQVAAAEPPRASAQVASAEPLQAPTQNAAAEPSRPSLPQQAAAAEPPLPASAQEEVRRLISLVAAPEGAQPERIATAQLDPTPLKAEDSTK